MSVQEIRIKNDGKWYADDRLMFRKPIVKLFATNLMRDENYQYFISLGQETFPVVVEDVPFLATDAYVDEGAIVFVLYDEQELRIEKEVPVVFIDDTPYLSFRWENDTRISRSAFWMVSNFLVERDNQVYLVPPGKLHD
ncbi:MAG: DUF1285 domain-containing protein [Syntrophomonadaceae bacterium]|nr:DUF1285 domain-containing protein [Syntrophomonadaceae bacterium]